MSQPRRGARAGDLCPAGQHPLPVGWRASTGCRGCLNDLALADTIVVIVAALPAVTEHVVEQALLAVMEGGRPTWYAQRYRHIAAYLAEHPDGLTSGASTTPVDVARLITQLRRLGRDDVTDPRCADCGRTCFPRHHRPDGLRICITCDGRRRYAECGQCGHHRPIFRRLPTGSPLCQRCHQADPDSWETCGCCTSPARCHPPSSPTYSASAAPPSRTGPPSPPGRGPTTSATASPSPATRAGLTHAGRGRRDVAGTDWPGGCQ